MPVERPDLAAELAEAEAAEAEAVAEAARAQARAAELRGERDDAERSAEPPLAESDVTAPSRWARVAPRLGVAVGGVLIGGLAAWTGVMLWQHGEVVARRAQDSVIVEAARSSVTALLSIDHTRARADVQRVLELSTGAFREDFEKSADDFVATAEKSKAVTKGTINAAALDSAGQDSGVVLIAATSQVTNASGAREDPRPFRMSVTMTRDGGQFKMSDLEFVP